MQFTRHLKLLVWKNYKLHLRRPVSTLIEICLPVVFFLVVVYMKVNTSNAQDRKVGIPSSAIRMSIKPYLLPVNGLVYTPVTNDTTAIMAKVFSDLNGSLSTDLGYNSVDYPDSTLAGVGSTEEMESMAIGGIGVVGVVFNTADLSKYELRFPYNPYCTELVISANGTYSVPDDTCRAQTNVWDTDKRYNRSPFNLISSPIDDIVDNLYMRSGAAFMQSSLNNRIFDYKTGESNAGYWLNVFSLLPYIESGVYVFATVGLVYMLPLLLMLAYMYPVLTLVRDIVKEKEDRLKEMMKMMGVSGGTYYLSWVINSFLLFFTSMLIGCAVLFLAGAFDQVNISIVLIFMVLYILAIVQYCMFVASLCHSSKLAAPLSGILFVILHVPFLIEMDNVSNYSAGKVIMSCLSMNMCMGSGFVVISQFEGIGRPMNWPDVSKFSTPEANYSMQAPFIGMIVNILVFSILTFYIENVFPGKYGVSKPWHFIISRPFMRLVATISLPKKTRANPHIINMEKDDKDYQHEHSDNNNSLIKSIDINSASAFEEEPYGLVKGVEIFKMSKVYDNGKQALTNLSMNFYKGQITCLLGHNGSGKSTTMSLLCGVYEPSSGTALINGHDIRTNMPKCRESLGYCPQTNVLFESLTIEEQLWFFGNLKGVNIKQLNEEVEVLLADLRLTEKRKAYPCALSGGMKRKFCIGVSFIGKASVIFLDEPTAGMDASARRSIWDLICKYREGKTIILTTHFMDEANLLGNRIAILNEGKLTACGTSAFLKRKIGAGYQITIVKTKSANVSLINAIVHKHLPDAVLFNHVGMELTYRACLDSQSYFPFLFKELDMIGKDRLGIESYGVSCSTLEEVFIAFTKEHSLTGDGDTNCNKSNAIFPTTTTTTSNNNITEACNNWYCRWNLRNCSTVCAKSKDPNQKRIQNLALIIDKESERENKKMGLVSTAYRNNISKGKLNKSDKVNTLTVSHHNYDVISIGNSLPGTPTTPMYPNMNGIIHDVPSASNDDPVISTLRYDAKTGFSLIVQQSRAMLWKRFLSAKRSYKMTLFQLIVPILFVVASVIVSSIASKPLSAKLVQTPLLMDLDFYNDPSKQVEYSVLYANSVDNTNDALILQNLYSTLPTAHFTDLGTLTESNFQTSLVSKLEDDKTYMFMYKTVIGLQFSNFAPNQPRALTTIRVSTVSDHSLPMGIQQFSNMMFKAHGNLSNYQLEMSFSPFTEGNARSISSISLPSGNFAIGFLTLMGVSFLTSSFVLFLVKERESMSKQIQFLTGVTPYMYWLTTFAWDLMNYFLIVIILYVIFIASGVDAYTKLNSPLALIILLIGYGWGFIPMLYLMQRFYKSPIRAYSGAVLLNFITGTVPLIVIYALRLIGSNKIDSSTQNSYFSKIAILYKVFYIFPNFSFGAGIVDMSNNWSLMSSCLEFLKTVAADPKLSAVAGNLSEQMCYDGTINETYKKIYGTYFINDYYYIQGSMLSMTLPGIGGSVISLFLTGLIYISLVIITEYYDYAYFINWFSTTSKFKDSNGANSTINQDDGSGDSGVPINDISTNNNMEEDSDVKEERDRILKGNYVYDRLVIERLSKVYPATGSSQAVLAVDELTLGMQSGECFGLLGANGAGKTTTFKMLTGEIIPSSGDARLDGKSVRHDYREVQSQIGYCPQFDALFDLLTGKETLEFYALLRGYDPLLVDELVFKAVSQIDLTNHANRNAGTYSGGNKRKLQTAIALLGQPLVVYLDEPTTGVDPATRRFLWNIITNLVRQGQLVVLTSHSMEECEALCTRLVIMSAGKSKCLGSIQHLKSKFGNEIYISFKLKYDQDTHQIKQSMVDAFPMSLVKSEYQGMLTFAISNEYIETLSWGTIFEKVLIIATEQTIEDYSITQATLEEIFLQVLERK